MKRSEMLTKMRLCYETCSEIYGNYNITIDRLLEICEENGMLPPKTLVLTDSFEGFVNKWEEETDPDDSDNYCGIV